jgi:hypothetical protein
MFFRLFLSIISFLLTIGTKQTAAAAAAACFVKFGVGSWWPP